MKRQQLLRHLRQHGCVFQREGGKHTTVYNPATHRQSRVPRHREVKATLAREICKQLGVPPPAEK
jgi:hypothetical protein